MAQSEMPYMDYWANTMYPVIKADFERLLHTTPKRIADKKTKAEKIKKEKKEKAENEPMIQEAKEAEKKEKKDKAEKKDPVREKLASICEEVKVHGERLHAFCNLTWTGPVDNAFLQEQIKLGKVENMAADLFLGNMPTDRSDETAPESQDDGATKAPQPQIKAGRGAAATLIKSTKKPFQIPTKVEKGFEIPVLILEGFEIPEVGKFKRLGMCIVVNAVWLAYFWAKQEGNIEAATAIEELILDWPFDFIHIQGGSPEEIEVNKFKWGVNMTARHERLRDFMGLENTNLLLIVARAADFEREQTVSRGKPTPEKVQQWLQEHVKWGLLHCPDTKTVKRHMDNWAALQKCPTAMALMDAATNHWGRDNLFDWPTKVQIICQKTDGTTLDYVAASLYTQMWRKEQKDPYSSGALGDVIAEIIWGKAYVASLLRKFPEVLNPSCNSDAPATADHPLSAIAAAQSIKTVKSYLDNPHEFFLRTEGPDKDPTWLLALPNEALRLLVQHCLDILQGYYKPEIAGALKQPKSERYNAEQFLKGSRVAVRFFGPFQIAYDSLVSSRKGGIAASCDDVGLGSAAATATAALVEEVRFPGQKAKVEQQITG